MPTPQDRATHFRSWLEEKVSVPDGTKSRRELLSVARWCEIVGYSRASFNQFLNATRGLPEPHLSNLETIAEGFGYQPLTNEHHFL